MLIEFVIDVGVQGEGVASVPALVPAPGGLEQQAVGPAFVPVGQGCLDGVGRRFIGVLGIDAAAVSGIRPGPGVGGRQAVFRAELVLPGDLDPVLVLAFQVLGRPGPCLLVPHNGIVDMGHEGVDPQGAVAADLISDAPVPFEARFRLEMFVPSDLPGPVGIPVVIVVVQFVQGGTE